MSAESIRSILSPYLGHIDRLTGTSSNGKNDYVHPALRNLGTVSIVIVREIIAPAVFRNLESEITSITLEDVGKTFVRAVPNKFKHPERRAGLQILRRFGAGGRYPQNRNAVPDKAPLSEVFDMNALVFGDSVYRSGAVLPVKAAVSYSDALSLVPYVQAVDKTFHNRASEAGTLFDAATGKNSTALFERHFVVPGTLLVQVISTSGRLLPFEGLEHLILSMGVCGSYGGQTSITGVNVASHIVGIYASRIERRQTSPYHLATLVTERSVADAVTALHAIVEPEHEVAIGREAAEAWRASLLNELRSETPKRLADSYEAAHAKLGALFTEWFTGSRAA